MTKLVRTRDGKVVHRPECIHAASGEPWDRVADMSDAWVRAVVKKSDLKLCQTCRPLQDGVR